jgi:hypothetical protein
MKQIINKFRYGMMAGAIALTIPLAANSAPCSFQDIDYAGFKQPDVLTMQNEIMSMRCYEPKLMLEFMRC